MRKKMTKSRKLRFPDVDNRPEVRKLLTKIKADIPHLYPLLEQARGHWGYEDHFYRLYHGSFKVYRVQDDTLAIVKALKRLSSRPLNQEFLTIIKDGTKEKKWELSHNAQWLLRTRPMIEAFAHARFFLEMICKYGVELDAPPACLPSGWAAVLYLYDLR
jgi:hypothetical protein